MLHGTAECYKYPYYACILHIKIYTNKDLHTTTWFLLVAHLGITDFKKKCFGENVLGSHPWIGWEVWSFNIYTKVCPGIYPSVKYLGNIKGVQLDGSLKKQGNVHNSKMDPYEIHLIHRYWLLRELIGLYPFSVVVTTSIITCFVGDTVTFSLKNHWLLQKKRGQVSLTSSLKSDDWKTSLSS